MSRVLISVSYCCDHRKGGDAAGAPHIPGQEHAEWLEEAVDYYRSQTVWPIIVACTAYRGITNIPVGPGYYERDVMWRVFAKTRAIVGVPENPGHQVGAALTIRLGLETAAKLDCDYLIHTAEDVLPRFGALRDMMDALQQGCDYAGEAWDGGELCSQFFACRVQALVGPWDACQVGGVGHLELYLARLLEGRQRWLTSGTYRHTHDHSEWNRWRREQG